MGSRRGFLKSLFAGGAGAVAAGWATVGKAKPTKQLAEDRPNCLLAEQGEVWTLVDPDRTKLPVQRIEVQLDFEPAVTWEYPLTAEEMVERGLIQGIRKPDGTLEIGDYPAGTRMFSAQRRVFPRMTEKELRADYALQQEGLRPLASAGQLIDVTETTTSDDLMEREKKRDAIIVKSDTTTPFDKILRNRMTNCYVGWQPGDSFGQNRRIIPPGAGEPRGIFAVLRTPTVVQYALGVCEFETTSANMIIQAPARALFG